MNLTSLPEVLPVDTPPEMGSDAPVSKHEGYIQGHSPARKKSGNKVLSFARAFLGWMVRWLLGALFCMNYFTSIVVMGWSYRWMQALALKSWWKRSRIAKEESFREFCDRLGPRAPVPRPRFLIRECFRATLLATPDNRLSDQIRYGLRILTLPWHSLWCNFKTGSAALFCTYLLTGWGCLLMVFGWEFGWLNSFHKGYELSAVGVLTSLLGMLLFIVSLYYVLMAQVHQAVTGDRRAFFDFRFVWNLIRSRATAYCGLVMLLALISLPLELMKVAVLGGQFFGNNDSLTHEEVLRSFLGYVFLCSLVFFPLLLLVRWLASLVYCSAVMKVLRTGLVTKAELHPTLAKWFDQLELKSTPIASLPGWLTRIQKWSGWMYRNSLIYVLMFVVWFLFLSKKYVGEFLVYHPVFGFMNHELVQFPTMDIIPLKLWQDGTQRANETPPGLNPPIH